MNEKVKLLSKTLNVPRSKMPQIKSSDVRDYIKFLRKNDVKVDSGRISIRKLNMTQKDINTDKIQKLTTVKRENLSKPIIVSNDNYILDGHHRTLALFNIDPKSKIRTISVDLPIRKLLAVTAQYPKVSFKGINEIVPIQEATSNLKLRLPKHVKDIHKAFKREGKKLYVVGGAVRDAILGKKPKDFDLATDAKPDEVLDIANKHGFNSAEVGKSFGVVIVNGEEIATFRKDVGKGRRPDSVDYTDIEGDVKRRDLTINALFYDIERGEIVDLVGGIEDLKKKNIRTVGKAERRFDEDPLRKLRVLRFASRIGGTIEPATLEALQSDPDISGVSDERIRDEFVKAVKTAQSTEWYLQTAEDVKILPQVFPRMTYKKDFIDENNYKLLIAYLFRHEAKPQDVYKDLKKIKYTHQESYDIKFLIKLVRFHPDNIYKLKRMQENVELSEEELLKWGVLINQDLSKFIRFELSVSGEEVMDMGFKGREIGKQIEKMEKEKFLSENVNEGVNYSRYKKALEDLKRGIEKGNGELGEPGLIKMYYENAMKLGIKEGFIDDKTRRALNRHNKKEFSLSGMPVKDAAIKGIEIALKNLNENEVKGGLADGKSPSDIAKHHNVSKDHIMKQLKMGVKVEMEHTDDKEISVEIALDHLWEDPDYYTKLKKIEPQHETLKEAPYKGNMGFEEMMKFYDIASDSEISKMEKLIDKGREREAWNFLQDVTGVKLENVNEWSPFKLRDGFKFKAEKTFKDIKKGYEYVIKDITGKIGNKVITVVRKGDSKPIKVPVHSMEEFYSKVMGIDNVFATGESKKPKTVREYVKKKLINNLLSGADIYIEDTKYSSAIEDKFLREGLKSHFSQEMGILSEEKMHVKNYLIDNDKDLFTEMVIQETMRILSESKSMPGVIDVPSSIADDIVKDFKEKVLKKTKNVKLDSIVGLGSTRQILQKLPNAKKASGDIDLLAIAKSSDRKAAKEIADYVEKQGWDNNIAFGNIVTIAYPYKGKKYQVDLMLANPSEEERIYDYMRKFKFYSDEDPNQDGDFILKGAHRSELAKTIVKAVGLSASNTGFKQFIWNNDFKNLDELVEKLRSKANRFRNKDKKEQTSGIADLIDDKVKSLNKLNKIMTGGDDLLSNRYPGSLFKNYPEGYQVLIDLLFKKEATAEKWSDVLDDKFNITKSINRMNKFDDVLDLIQTLLKNRIITPRSVVGVFNEMKDNFDTGKAAGRWNRSLEEYIEDKFPFLKGRW